MGPKVGIDVKSCKLWNLDSLYVFGNKVQWILNIKHTQIQRSPFGEKCHTITSTKALLNRMFDQNPRMFCGS